MAENLRSEMTEAVVESKEERNLRFSRGEISETEIREHWKNPRDFLFEQEITQRGDDGEKIKFRVRALTEEYLDPLLKEIKSAWDETSFEEISATLKNFFKQKKLAHPTLSNTEYYIATDLEDHPFAITGLFTLDIGGGAGFATRDKLNPEKHNLITRGGWLAVSKKYQGAGIGGFLFDWKENLARSRGSKFMLTETDNYKNSETARKLYNSRGYKSGFYIEDYFGPERDLATYYLDVSKNETAEEMASAEEVSEENSDELKSLATEIYSKDRKEEFDVCLELLLEQETEKKAIRKPHSFVLRDKDGIIKSFAIMTTGVYENALTVHWFGARPSDGNLDELVDALKNYAKSVGIDVIILSNEGRDDKLEDAGFTEVQDGIPGVYTKGDPTKFLLYSKKL